MTSPYDNTAVDEAPPAAHEPPADGQVPVEVLRARMGRAYGQQSREEQEERWILDHLPLVRHIVQKMGANVHGAIDEEDLISAGTLGLIKAAKAYDPTREAEFKTYAYIRIRGAVLDELRGASFVPTGVHGQLRRIKEAYQAHTAEHGAPPDDEQLAARLGIAPAQLYRTLEEARRQHFLSIHGLTDEKPALDAFLPPDRRPGPDEQASRREILERLAAAIRELPERDRRVILLYYDRDLTMKEAAAVLGVTESRISQLHAGAVFKLAMKLGTA